MGKLLISEELFTNLFSDNGGYKEMDVLEVVGGKLVATLSITKDSLDNGRKFLKLDIPDWTGNPHSTGEYSNFVIVPKKYEFQSL